MMPQPTLRERSRSAAVRAAALSSGYTPLQADLLAARLPCTSAANLQATVAPSIENLDPPDLLPDIDKAAGRIADAVIGREAIHLCCDHDVDGVTSMTVLRAAFLDYFHFPAEKLHSWVSHRMREGYGISDGVVDRILAAGHGSGLLISADQGSSDGPRIERLAQAGIETIVTDHHGVEGQGPAAAFACINPVREDSQFPDRAIAGVHVAWLTLCAVRRVLLQRGYLPADSTSLGGLLDYVALGTVADCVSLGASANNRFLVRRGLQLMNSRPRPCWQALREQLKLDGPFTSETLAFQVGPRINARGRLDEAMGGVRFLRAQTIADGRTLASMLQEDNEDRKRRELVMKEAALKVALKQVVEEAVGIAVWLEDGHAGVHGIVASRLVAVLGRPTLCLSPKQGKPGIASASARSIPGFNVRQAFAEIAEQDPDLLIAWGGHAGAGGLTVRVEDIPVLQAYWDDCVRRSGVEVGPVILTDGALPRAPDFAMLAEIAAIGPFGREFEAPQFSELVQVLDAKALCEGKHLKLTMAVHGRPIAGIWFNIPDGTLDWARPGAQLRVVFELGANTYRGNTTLQAIISHARQAA